MEGSSTKCESRELPQLPGESENGDVSQPSYQGGLQDVTVPIHQGEVQEEDIPTHSDGKQEIQMVSLPEPTEIFTVVSKPDPPLETYYACSLFVMIFCCLPFGIVALVNASKQRTRTLAGDLEGARHFQPKAKKWSYMGFFTGPLIIGVIIIILRIFSVLIPS